jgi:acetyl esterase/lipase
MNADDDVFADDYDDDGGALDQVRAQLRADRADQKTLSLAARRAMRDEGGARAALPPGWSASARDLGRSAELLSGPSAAATRMILYFHGGGFGIGSLKSHRGLASQLGHAAQSQVLTLDYRLAPENPYPAALEDAVTAYRMLLDEGRAPQSIVLMGDSAGGGLAIAAAQRINAMSLPLPLAVVALCPWLDYGLTGDSLRTRAEADPSLNEDSLRAQASAYLAGANAKAASPLFGDLTGLPPTLLHIGSDDILLSDSERFVATARQLGVDATVEIWPGLFHVWHAYYEQLEDAREGINEIGAWLKRRWK